MIITITRKTIPFKEVIVEDLTCPISGRIEPMRLILSKEETNAMGMSVTVAKNERSAIVRAIHIFPNSVKRLPAPSTGKF